MEHEDGTKSYVSPEKQAHLLVEEKIKKSEAKLNLKNEKNKRKSRYTKTEDSDSDSAYETPISAMDNFSFAKPKSCGDLDKILSVPATPQRNSSFSCFEDNYGGNNEKINLPPFIKPLETSLTFPIAKKKIKEKNKKRNSGDSFEGKRESKMIFEISSPKEKTEKVNSAPEFDKNEETGRDEVDGRKIFFSRRSIPIWEKDKKKTKNYEVLPETEPLTKENSFKLLKKRLSLPWIKDKEKLDIYAGEKPVSDSQLEEKPKNFLEEEEMDSPKSLKHISFKPLSLFKNQSKTLKVEEERGKEESFILGEGDKTPQDKNYSNPSPSESKPSLLELIDEKMAQDLKEPEEVFLEDIPKTEKKYGVRGFIPSIMSDKYKKNIDSENSETTETTVSPQPKPKRYSYGFSLPRYPDSLVEQKIKRSRNKEKFDPNPLQKMFGIRNVKKMQKDNAETGKNVPDLRGSYQEKNFDEGEVEVKIFDSSDVSNIKQSDKTFLKKKEKLTNDFFEPKVTVETDKPSHRLTLNLTGEKQFDLEEIPTRSDTESADHGSADKSSMSKLTTQKQPKKLMSGLLGSFKKGKAKEKVADADLNRSLPPSLEITIKEQPEEVHINGTPKSEGIVYAELDMARPGGNLMRRDEGEKTEYAEIIYPSNKLFPERAVDELRKSRENLVSSRENLAETEEAFTTTITPDGKKEAAV